MSFLSFLPVAVGVMNRLTRLLAPLASRDLLAGLATLSLGRIVLAPARRITRISTATPLPSTTHPPPKSDPNPILVVQENPGWGKLPEELSRSVTILTAASKTTICDLYLVGTTHRTHESCKRVQAVIQYLKPEVVFLELSPSEMFVLNSQKLEVPTMREMIDMFMKRHDILQIFSSLVLAKASNLDPSENEFRVAFEEASKYGAKVILGDQPTEITFRRTWEQMPLWLKTTFMPYLFIKTYLSPIPRDKKQKETNRAMDIDTDELEDIDEIDYEIQMWGKVFPTLTETILHERDRYMSSKLLEIASNHTSVVAVVGRAHLLGIKYHMKQQVM